jgi:alkylresorcinol/alkylpyrone synthase
MTERICDVPQLTQLISTATAVPANILLQSDVATAAGEIFGPRFREFDRMAKVFDSAGIHKRHAARPIEWFFEPRGWPERTAVYLETAGSLFIEAATKALDEAGLTAADIDTVVTISSTGIATPSLEARVSGQVGFRSDIERVPVFGLGCAGGVSGLAIGARLAQARPGTNVLVVAVELCTLSFRLDEMTKANIVATALFGDGAAACILRAGEGGMADVEFAGQHTWPNTLDIMGWSVDPQGFGVIFDRSIPPFAEAEMGPAVDGILARHGLTRSDIDRFACHPGGIKVVDALERALSLEKGSLDIEREVLNDYGNMSAPTALFVLDRLRRRGLQHRSLLTAMGPGFSASCVSLRAVA